MSIRLQPRQCEKMAILRQNLVARRKKRSHEVNSENKENSGRLNITEYSKERIDMPPRSMQLKSRRDITPTLQLQQMSLEEDATTSSSGSVNQSQASDSSDIEQRSNNKLEDEESVVEIELIKCECCKRSFAPKVYEKHFDGDGQPKCLSQMSKKRAVFNSAKVRNIIQYFH